MANLKGKKRISLRENRLNDISLFALHQEHILYCEARRLRPCTIENYRRNYRLLEECLGKDFIVSQFDESVINEYIKYISTHYSNKATTINTRIRYIRLLLNFAYERDYCKHIKVVSVKECRENKIPLMKEEVQKLIAKPKEPSYNEYRMWVIVNLVLSTGIRSRNVREVRVNDLDLHNRTLFLKDTKAHKSQTLYLNKSVVKILGDWLKLTQLSKESPLFPSFYGDEMASATLKCAFRRYAYDRGVKTSLHILRHTYARDLVKADVNPIIIKELLNHQSLEVTQRYIRLFSSEIQEATDGLDTLAQYQKNRIKLGGSK